MHKGSIGTWISIIFIVLTILFFLITLPGATNLWYRQGAGHSFMDQIEAGIDEAIARPKAFADGYKYAILMVAGFPFPLMLLILITIGIISRVGSKTFQVRLKIAFPIVCLMGTICLGYAQNMVSWQQTGLSDKLGSAFIIWLIFAAIAGLFILIANIIRRLTHKTETTDLLY
ncbi:MAG: hypothetical protein KKB81_07165 [Candidatus Margulisbacteria bacterium]|nr:hypothetical protein [Candidatus Margulisiibacteriota bacterium]MBU1022339.1 hypothetical protein [Candidatus Margulisiibacteriota bacterium]MBU1728405.1 hypothetical protein [Candidatus Margulisiibacteriota bacterium]MBU1955236.1 hypothetical protein [Candidatus Margulisiibacteriota bacterium]